MKKKVKKEVTLISSINNMGSYVNILTLIVFGNCNNYCKNYAIRLYIRINTDCT
jgi:hypothetical protein